MDRNSLRVAALATTAFLAIACSDAFAQAPESPSDPATPAAGQPALKGVIPASPGQDDSSEGSADEAAALALEEDSGAVSAPQDPATPQEEVQPSVSVTVGDPPPASAPAPERAPAAPGAPGAGGNRIDETPAADSEAPPAAATAFAASSSAVDPPAADVPPLVPPGSASPRPVAEVSPTRGGRPTRDGLGQLLSEVGRELRSAQGQIDDLRSGLDEGAPPPTRRLTRLRETLVRIAPMLLALEVRLHAAGELSPQLRQLLKRVRSDLRGVHVTSASLAAELRRSGARSAELRQLLQEVEAFRALASTLALNPGVSPPPAPAPPATGSSPEFTPLQPGPAASAPPAASEPPAPRAGDRHAPGSSARPALAELLQWSLASGSATVGSGGSFFFVAAVAALTVLLIGIALPALRTRLELPRHRRYAVAFLTPLERPG
jgi:hypothetical protein